MARYWAVIAENVDIKLRLELIRKSQRFFLSIAEPDKEQSNFNLATHQYQIVLYLIMINSNTKNLTKKLLIYAIILILQNCLIK